MTDRTIKFLGYGIGNTQSTITATVAGNVVYTGNVAMVPTRLPNNLLDVRSPLMFSIVVDIETIGTLPISVSVDANTSPVAMGLASFNYSKSTLKGSLTDEQFINIINDPDNATVTKPIQIQMANPPLSESESAVWNDDTTPYSERYSIEETHNMFLFESSGVSWFIPPRGNPVSNVILDGNTIAAKSWFIVPAGSTVSYYLTIPAPIPS